MTTNNFGEMKPSDAPSFVKPDAGDNGIRESSGVTGIRVAPAQTGSGFAATDVAKPKSWRRPIRWLTFGMVALLLAGLFYYVRTTQGVDDSFRMAVTNLSILASLVLLSAWFVFFGGWRWWGRLLILFVGWSLFVAAVMITFNYLVEVRGVTGDWVPNFAWKWTPKADYRLPNNPAAETPMVAPAPTNEIPDYPRFLGPNGEAHLSGISLDPNWEKHPPRELWRKPIGSGSSSFAVVQERAVTQEQRGDWELVTCYNLRDGALLWTHRDETRFQEFQAGAGPQATPTIVDGKVFTMGGTGILNCLDLKTGKSLWEKGVNVVEEDGAKNPMWGKSCSPLVFDQMTAEGVKQLVVVTLGDPPPKGKAAYDTHTLAAFDGATGKRVWAATTDPVLGTDRQGYATPILTTIADTKQIISVNATTVTGHDPATGNLLWTYDWLQQMAKCSQPVVLGDGKIFLSMGYHVGGQLIQVDKKDQTWSAVQVWDKEKEDKMVMRTTFSNVVVYKDHMYGLDDGVLQCIDPLTGATKWRKGNYRYGQILGVDDLLIVQSEKGKVFLVAAKPDQFQELAVLDALHDKTWNNPVLVGKYLLLRNAVEAVCYELPLKDGK
jgi:outer membrane protein assembly factor BamB